MAAFASHGRPRSFDPNDALRAVMEAFWAGGYAGTSYDDLERATRLRRQSLIYAFGDKRALFAKALELYAAERVEEVVGLLGGDGPALDAVESAFAAWASDAEIGTRRGCLMVNTAGEMGRLDTAISDAIAQATTRLQKAFAAAFRRAREAGELRIDVDPDDLARLAVAAGDGALLHARTSATDGGTAQTFSAFLRLLR